MTIFLLMTVKHAGVEVGAAIPVDTAFFRDAIQRVNGSLKLGRAAPGDHEDIVAVAAGGVAHMLADQALQDELCKAVGFFALAEWVAWKLIQVYDYSEIERLARLGKHLNVQIKETTSQASFEIQFAR